MTTDQIESAESTVGAPGFPAGTAVTTDRAASEARQMIAKARYEAFKMVTDARSDAESILGDARAEAAELASAGDSNTVIAGENADLVAVNAALRVEYNELVDLINTSQDVVEKLDARLVDLATMSDTIVLADSEASAEMAPDDRATAAPYVFDYTPSVAPAPKPSSRMSTERAESFYTRKSAKLPRIGREGGKDALDIVRAMRDSMREQNSN